ncbi:hypothetical protein BH10ACT9_BH10ACT9_59140 [soil metagenome]
MSTSTTSARRLRGSLVGACSAVVTAAAHTAAGGSLPQGGALMMATLVCGVAGAAVGSAALEGRRLRLLGVVTALTIAQVLGHLTMVTADSHHHIGMGWSPTMVAAHAIAAIVLGMAITAVEYLYTVCASVLSWLRLFAAAALQPALRLTVWATNAVAPQSVLLLSGLGMRAPPSGTVTAA